MQINSSERRDGLNSIDLIKMNKIVNKFAIIRENVWNSFIIQIIE